MADPLYTGDGIEAYEPAGVGGGIGVADQHLQGVAPWLKWSPSYLLRQNDATVAALEARVQRLEAENQRLATLLADAENKATPLPAVTTVADIWANVLRANGGRPR